MKTQTAAHTVTLEPNDARYLASLCGQFDAHLRQIEQRLNIEIHSRGNVFALYGNADNTAAAGDLLRSLYREASS
ncbi:MAG: PhoH family protein, partial [Porticoccaceae bacterium]|nr:PhoH family protein [Porticoccaceae bacterium]